MQFGSSNSAVFFKMRVAGVLHIYQFETKQVQEFKVTKLVSCICAYKTVLTATLLCFVRLFFFTIAGRGNMRCPSDTYQ